MLLWFECSLTTSLVGVTRPAEVLEVVECVVVEGIVCIVVVGAVYCATGVTTLLI